MQLTLLANRATITGDPFIAFFITDLLRSLRTQYIIDIIKSYTRLSLDFLAKTLNIGRDEAEGLVVGLILDEKIKGRIDQVQGVVVLDRLSVVHSSILRGDLRQWSELTRPVEQTRPGSISRWGRWRRSWIGCRGGL